MPIPELENIVRLPRAAKIHLGEKRISESSGKEYPRAVDYFVWPEEYAAELNGLFGEKCREIPIMFPSNDRETVAPTWYKRYGSSTGLACKGDGNVATRIVMRKNPETGELEPTGEMEEVECLGQDCEYYQKKHCRHVMNLMFIIPQLLCEGVFQLDTSSFHSIVNFNSSWHFVAELTHGKVAMIPLVLRLVPKEVSPDGRKKVVYVLEIKLARGMTLPELQAIAEGHAPRAELPAPDESGEADHFYPREVRPGADDIKLDESLEGDLEVAEGEIVDDDEAPDELDNKIEDLCAALELTEAQKTLFWKRVEGDKRAMADLLTEQYEEKSNVKTLRRGRGQNKKDAAQTGEHGQAELPRADSDEKKPTTPAASGSKKFF